MSVVVGAVLTALATLVAVGQLHRARTPADWVLAGAALAVAIVLLLLVLVSIDQLLTVDPSADPTR